MKTYRFNGQWVFLARTCNVPGVEPLAYIGDIGAYRRGDYNGCDALLTTDEDYNGESFDSVDVIHGVCRSPENEQGLVEGWWTLDYAIEDEFKREFLVVTDRYFDWRSKREKMEDEIWERSHKGRISDTDYRYLEKEWDEMVQKFNIKNETYFAAPFDDVLEDTRIKVED